MSSENIGTTKRRKQMALKNKNKDNSIYYYGQESKYISGNTESKSPFTFFIHVFQKKDTKRRIRVM